MTLWWDRGLFLLFGAWTLRAAWLNAELAAFVARPVVAWTFEIALGLAGLGALALRGDRRRAWLSFGLGLAALRGAYLGGLLADASGGSGLLWPDLAVGLTALLSLTLWALQRRPRPASASAPGSAGGARSAREARP